MKLLVRADSSSQIGLGHIMRDLVLVQQYPNATIAFACQELAGNIIDKIPYPVHILGSNDPKELMALIHSLEIDRVIFDHYDIDETFERAIKEQTGISILSLDDTYQKHYCDILINPNLYGDKARYNALVPVDCSIRCGKEFTLIRDEFKDEKIKTREKIYTIFIAMGGSDSANLTLSILKTLQSKLNICVVTTRANKHLKLLEKYVQENKNITVHIDSKEIAKLLHQSTLAIITPSSIAHEVMFMEIPFIAIQSADNQNEFVAYMEHEHLNVLRCFEKEPFLALLEKLL